MRMQFARYTLWKTVHDKQPVSAVRKTRVREGERKRNYRLKIEQINKTKKKRGIPTNYNLCTLVGL